MTTSIWESEVERKGRAPLEGDAQADVVVIGAGITGLTCALELKRAGRRVRVVDKAGVGSGVTGYTSAHLSLLADAGYAPVAKSHGNTAARLLAAALKEAVDYIERNVLSLGIDCSFTRVPGYLYAASSSKKDTEKVEAEIESARAAGLDIESEPRPPLPFEVAFAARVASNARFQPLRYLEALASAVEGDGCAIHEHTRVRRVADGDPCRIETDRGTLSAAAVVVATHTPLGIHVLQTALGPYRSYVLAGTTQREVGDALFWDTASPYHYIRKHWTTSGEPVLIIGGADHKVAHGSETAAFEELERYARDTFGVDRVVQRWSAQVYEPADGLPFIGRSVASRATWVSTGYSGDGLTLGTAGGRLVAKQIIQAAEDDDASRLFRPTRFNPKAAAKEFIQENADVAYRMVKDWLSPGDRSAVDAVGPGEGRVIRSGAKQLAVYRAPSGNLHVCSAVCPHLKCIVRWNAAETSWDCPCHGSRFDTEGRPIEGPALHDLHPVESSQS